MFASKTMSRDGSQPLAALDRLAIGYLTLPLFIFLIGWLEWWAAAIFVVLAGYALWPTLLKRDGPPRLPLTAQQIAIAVVIGSIWTVLGGIDHFFFANSDWHVRDAVLHDLVVSSWPVGYGLHEGHETLLRAPLGFYLPAALVGKMTSLAFAHATLLLWTAVGAILFLLQAVSLVDSRMSAALVAVIVVVFFSGADIVGNLLNDGPRFRSDWDLPMHLEWWAGSYQYSSMTTQLFWVPNHALCGWLMIGLLYRYDAETDLQLLLPILTVAAALWSPLTALGLVPFVTWRVGQDFLKRKMRMLDPRIWLPALFVGLAISAYLVLSVGSVQQGSSIDALSPGDVAMSILRQAQFFILEAGLIGLAVALIRRSSDLMIALVVLALLPALHFGPANDLVMRASIPALTVVAISAFLALLDQRLQPKIFRKKAFLAGLLLVGAMTPIAEISRAIVLPAWPINLKATLIGVDCGGFAPHYVAEIGGQIVTQILRPPNRLALGPLGAESCDNPALELMWVAGTHPKR